MFIDNKENKVFILSKMGNLDIFEYQNEELVLKWMIKKVKSKSKKQVETELEAPKVDKKQIKDNFNNGNYDYKLHFKHVFAHQFLKQKLWSLIYLPLK